MTNLHIFFLLLCTTGMTIISYKNYAFKSGWPIGTMFVSDSSIVKIIGLLSIVGSFIVSFFFIKWYIVLIGLLISWLLSGFITALLRKHTQIFSVFLFILSWIFLLIKF